VPDNIVVTSKFPNLNRLNVLIDGPRSGADACEADAESKAEDPIIKLRRFNLNEFFIFDLSI
ncbi:hypothetical protein N8090_04345, partial [Amylibacter sp.]|nr:hypothetical protein [Amylibacter sp.]